jgi:hypothetical protein
LTLTVPTTQNDLTAAASRMQLPVACATVAASATTGPDAIYLLPLGSGATVNVLVTSQSPSFDPAVYLLGDCDPAQCIVGANQTGAGGVEYLSYTNTGGSTRNLVLVVDSGATGGSFLLQVDANGCTPATGSCGSPRGISFGNSDCGDTTIGTNANAEPPDCSGGSAIYGTATPDDVWLTPAPAVNISGTLEVRPHGSWAPVVAMTSPATCNPAGGCFYMGVSPAPGLPAIVPFVQLPGAPLTIVVDGKTGSDQGQYTIIYH